MVGTRGTPHIRLLASALLVVTTGGVLAGCSKDKPEVAPAPTLSAPSPSPSHTKPVAPELPAAVKLKNQAGAEAAFRYWVETYTYGFATGDAMPMRAVVTGDCGYCAGVLDAVDQMHSQREHYVKNGLKVVVIVATPVTDSSYLLRAVLSQSGAVKVDEQGKPLVTEAAEPRVPFDVKVMWDVDRWRLDKMAKAEG